MPNKYACKQLTAKQRIFKNFLATNLATMFAYGSLGGVMSVQFVLMDDRFLALFAQIVIYTSQLATSFVIPQVILDLMGFKFGLVFCYTLVLSFIVVQVVPYSWTLLPSKDLLDS